MKSFQYKESVWTRRFKGIPHEDRMREGFIAVAQEICAEEELYAKNGEKLYVGMELELPLVHHNLEPIPQSVRDEMVSCFQNFASHELGAHQIEIIHNPPVELYFNGINAIEEGLKRNLELVRNSWKMIKTIYLGCYPFAAIDVEYTKGEPKYERCPKWHRDYQRPDAEKRICFAEQIDLSNPYVVALMNSTQMTVDATDFEDSIDKLNRSLMISPMAVALGANSRYLDLGDSGVSDVRFLGWEISHDSRSYEELKVGRPTRVGLPRRYYRDISDYFNRILSYPFVMDDEVSLQHAFEVGTGIYWRDARLKFFRDKKTLGVEFRPVSLQPNLHESVAMMVFYLGRLLWSQINQEPLLPINCISANSREASLLGLQGELFFYSGSAFQKASSKMVLEIEIDRAEAGLLSLGCERQESGNFLEPLRDRLRKGSPSECFAKEIKDCEEKHKMNRKEALIASMQKLGLIQSL